MAWWNKRARGSEVDEVAGSHTNRRRRRRWSSDERGKWKKESWRKEETDGDLLLLQNRPEVRTCRYGAMPFLRRDVNLGPRAWLGSE